jgi:hypothetical protein
LIVKLVAAERRPKSGAVAGRTLFVLHVTLSFVPRESSSWTMMMLLAVTAVVFTWQVPPLAFVAQLKVPAAAEVHEATEGFAAVPTPVQFAAVW